MSASGGEIRGYTRLAAGKFLNVLLYAYVDRCHQSFAFTALNVLFFRDQCKLYVAATQLHW